MERRNHHHQQQQLATAFGRWHHEMSTASMLVTVLLKQKQDQTNQGILGSLPGMQGQKN